ncbi:hypothetical protein M434DRAFT_15333 [Hypoxylon sp. CO27-5]|nr:hypothetical protein M434DRAFT_15333 [Hypoxylon sp. CO27-5]
MTISRYLESDGSRSPVASFPFNKFPAEIRFLIWEEALREESSERLVIIDHSTQKVIPFKSLVSPMLTVNKESRYFAVRFFDMKLVVCDLPSIRHPILSSFIGFFDYNEINESPTSKKRLYLSSQHDIFIAGLDLQPRAFEWCLVPAMCNGCQDDIQHTFYCSGFEHNFGNFPSTGRHYASEVLKFRSRIERVIPVCIDGFCPPYNSVDYCSCQPRHYSKDCASSFWSKTLFPSVKQYFYYPWGHKTKSRVGDLLQHLFQRRPGHPLPIKYRMKELVWSENVEDVSSEEGKEEIMRKNILVDPSLEHRRPCRCTYKNIGDDQFCERADSRIHEMMERMHRVALRSP